jgi:hypothetical protein
MKHVGREAECPGCNTKVLVPAPPGAGACSAPNEPVAPCGHPRLDDFYRLLIENLAPRYEHHTVVDGNPRFRLQLAGYRKQEVSLEIARNRGGEEILLVRSEIGTLSIFEEAAQALQLNRTLGKGRLFIDDTHLLQLEARTRLSEVDDDGLVDLVDQISQSADRFEEVLFGIDLR